MKSLFIRRMSQVLAFMLLVSGLDLSANSLKTDVETGESLASSKAKSAEGSAESLAHKIFPGSKEKTGMKECQAAAAKIKPASAANTAAAKCVTHAHCDNMTTAQCDLSYTYPSSSGSLSGTTINIPSGTMNPADSKASSDYVTTSTDLLDSFNKFHQTRLEYINRVDALKGITNIVSSNLMPGDSRRISSTGTGSGSGGALPSAKKETLPLETIPLSKGNMEQPVVSYDTGDFNSVFSSNPGSSEIGQLMQGYIQYQYNYQDGVKSYEKTILNAFGDIILYAMIAKKVNNKAEGINGYLKYISYLRGCKGYGTYCSNDFSAPETENILSLYKAVVSADFSGIVPKNLYSLIHGTDWTNFDSFFLNAKFDSNAIEPFFSSSDISYRKFYLSVLRVIAAKNVFYSCSIDAKGSPLDTNLYYTPGSSKAPVGLDGTPTITKATVSLSGQPGAVNGAVATGFLEDLTAYKYPATKFAYASGQRFYQIAAGDNVVNDKLVYGAAGLGGLGGEVTDPTNSLWAKTCSASANKSASYTSSAIVSSIGNIAGSQTAPLYADSVDLMQKLNKAVNDAPINEGSLKNQYSWVASFNAPLASKGPKTASEDGSVVVVPIFPQNLFAPAKPVAGVEYFMTGQHMNDILNLLAIRAKYSACWGTMVSCNQLAKSGGVTVDEVFKYIGYSMLVYMGMAGIFGVASKYGLTGKITDYFEKSGVSLDEFLEKYIQPMDDFLSEHSYGNSMDEYFKAKEAKIKKWAKDKMSRKEAEQENQEKSEEDMNKAASESSSDATGPDAAGTGEGPAGPGEGPDAAGPGEGPDAAGPGEGPDAAGTEGPSGPGEGPDAAGPEGPMTIGGDSPDIGAGPQLGVGDGVSAIQESTLKGLDLTAHEINAINYAGDEADLSLSDLRARAARLTEAYEKVKEIDSDEAGEARAKIEKEYGETREAAGDKDGFSEDGFPDLPIG